MYKLVFYKFATPFAKDQNAQFVTPLPLIDFLVNIVNPRNGETVIDPTVGIADFLVRKLVRSDWQKCVWWRNWNRFRALELGMNKFSGVSYENWGYKSKKFQSIQRY